MPTVSLLGASPAFLGAIRLIEKFARLSAPVLIEGETGTGKEMAARAIHYAGSHRDMPFVPVNCGAFPDSLFESELFGHVRGAFTDARMDHSGLVEAAAGGTLFLDEIDALSPKGQVAMLRFLQDGSYRPLGSRVERMAKVRIIAASNADLDRLADGNTFRSDLLFRLRVLPLKLPPLRERGSDVLLLAHAFFNKYRRLHECAVTALDESSCEWFGRYRWPGNIRELEGLIYREVMLCDDAILRLTAPPGHSAERRRGSERRFHAYCSMTFSAAKSKMIERFERDYLWQLMDFAQGNVTRAASMAAKERRALGKLLKKHGINLKTSVETSFDADLAETQRPQRENRYSPIG